MRVELASGGSIGTSARLVREGIDGDGSGFVGDVREDCCSWARGGRDAVYINTECLHGEGNSLCFHQ